MSDRAQPNSWQAVGDGAWLVGFLSGIAVAKNSDFIKGTDGESILLWMDNYCRSNPLKGISDGGGALFYELKKQKGLK